MIIYRLIIILLLFLMSCKQEEPEELILQEPSIDQNRFSDKYENDIYNYDSVDSISQDYE